MFCIEESPCGIVGTFQLPRGDSAPGELRPLVPLVTPLRTNSTPKQIQTNRKAAI